MSRALSVAEQTGMRLLLVHALNDEARAFYEHFGFESSPTDAMNFQLLIKDIRLALDSLGLASGAPVRFRWAPLVYSSGNVPRVPSFSVSFSPEGVAPSR
jgi:hypothetical protein